MTSHVSGQDYADEAQTERLEFISWQSIHEHILALVQDQEWLCGMVVFLDALVAVANCSLRYIVDMVGIGEAIVAVVMTDGRDANWKGVHLA